MLTKQMINKAKGLDENIMMMQLFRLRWSTDHFLAVMGNIMDKVTGCKAMRKGMAVKMWNEARNWCYRLHADIDSRCQHEAAVESLRDMSDIIERELKTKIFQYEQAYCRLLMKNNIPHANEYSKIWVASEMVHTAVVINAQEIQALAGTNNDISYMRRIGGYMLHTIPNTEEFGNLPTMASAALVKIIIRLYYEIDKNTGSYNSINLTSAKTDEETDRNIRICAKCIVDYLRDLQNMNNKFDKTLTDKVIDRQEMYREVEKKNQEMQNKMLRRAKNFRDRSNAKLAPYGLDLKEEDMEMLNEVFGGPQTAFKFLKTSIMQGRENGFSERECLKTALEVARAVQRGEKNPYSNDPSKAFRLWDVNKLGFNKRVKAIFKEHGIVTVNDILSQSVDTMMSWKGFGPKSMLHVNEIISRLGIEVNDKKNGVRIDNHRLCIEPSISQKFYMEI